jgi:hypothetical protein
MDVVRSRRVNSLPTEAKAATRWNPTTPRITALAVRGNGGGGQGAFNNYAGYLLSGFSV